MIRSTLYSPDAPAPGGFKLRGTEVSRLEGFSDAVFGFALTLLVVSLDVPTTFAELADRLRGVLAFAVCFAILVSIWYRHYVFFRRYGLADITTMLLNTALLFVVLLYVYPLKFLFTIVLVQVTGLGPSWTANAWLTITPADVRWLFIFFGGGFFLVSAIFAMMYGRALRLARSLDLSPVERFDTSASIVDSLGIGSVGLLSCALALTLPDSWLGMAGWIYFITGPVGMVLGMWAGSRRAKVRDAA